MSEAQNEEEKSPGVGTETGKEEASGSSDASALHSNGTSGSPFVVPAIGHSSDPQGTQFSSCHTPGFVDQSQSDNQFLNSSVNDAADNKEYPRNEAEAQEGTHMFDTEPATVGDETYTQSGGVYDEGLHEDNTNMAVQAGGEVDEEFGEYTAYSGSVVDSESEEEEINRGDDDIHDSYLKAASRST